MQDLSTYMHALCIYRLLFCLRSMTRINPTKQRKIFYMHLRSFSYVRKEKCQMTEPKATFCDLTQKKSAK